MLNCLVNGNKTWLAGTIDLNEPPPEFDYDFLDGGNANPSYSTKQALVPTLQEKTIKDNNMLEAP